MIKLLKFISKYVESKPNRLPIRYVIRQYVRLIRCAFGGYWGIELYKENSGLTDAQFDKVLDYFRGRGYTVISTHVRSSIAFRS